MVSVAACNYLFDHDISYIHDLITCVCMGHEVDSNLTTEAILLRR